MPRDCVMEATDRLRDAMLHVRGKKRHSAKPALLRMNRILPPKTNKVGFERVCLAVSTINGCAACIQSHERAVLEGGLTKATSVRTAATIRAGSFVSNT